MLLGAKNISYIKLFHSTNVCSYLQDAFIFIILKSFGSII